MSEAAPAEKYGRMEYAPTTLWDTEIVRRGKVSLSFFVQAKQNKADSNMYVGSYLPEPLTFSVRTLSVVGLHDHTSNGHAMLIIGNKHYFECPLWLFGFNRPPVPLCEDADIPPLLNFTVRLTWDEPLDLERLKLRCVMNGRMKRSVC